MYCLGSSQPRPGIMKQPPPSSGRVDHLSHTAVKEFLASPVGRGVRVENLPPYAPDLDPIEASWQHLMHVELAERHLSGS